jgi:hypothetical protein
MTLLDTKRVDKERKIILSRICVKGSIWQDPTFNALHPLIKQCNSKNG